MLKILALAASLFAGTALADNGPLYQTYAFHSDSGLTHIADVWESCQNLPSQFSFETRMHNVPMKGTFVVWATGQCSTPVWPNEFKGSFTAKLNNGEGCVGRMEAYAYQGGSLVLRWIFTGGYQGRRCSLQGTTVDSPYLNP